MIEATPRVHQTAIIQGGSVSPSAEIREYCTLHDSHIGDNCIIYERVTLKRVTLGKDSFVNTGSYAENVIIGERTQIGPNCSLPGVWHDFDEKLVSDEDVFVPITIGDNSLLGAGVIVTPGVKIGNGVVIGAGTIVTKDIPDHYICYGVPPNQTMMSIRDYRAKKGI